MFKDCITLNFIDLGKEKKYYSINIYYAAVKNEIDESIQQNKEAKKSSSNLNSLKIIKLQTKFKSIVNRLYKNKKGNDNVDMYSYNKSLNLMNTKVQMDVELDVCYDKKTKLISIHNITLIIPNYTSYFV